MRIVIADDDRIVVRSLATILGAQEDIQVVGTACGGDEALALACDLRPDVALLDIQMPGMDGIDCAAAIIARLPQTRVVFLTTFSDDDYITRALEIGASGYLIKQDVETIAPALRAVMAGQCVLEGQVLARATAAARGGAAPAGGTRPRGEAPGLAGGTARPGDDAEPALAALTRRERDVVLAVADGLSNAEIAAELCMSEGTVRNHISSILTKLGLGSRTQIAVYYYRNCH